MPPPAGVQQRNAAPQGAQIPFEMGSNFYTEKVFTDTFQPGANAQEFVHNITPGGFLRGMRLIVTSTGGVAGDSVLAADAPVSIFSSISLENIDGSPIIYPMNGFAMLVANQFFAPWRWTSLGGRPNFTATINPNFTLPIFAEIRDTAGVLANTDARAQYRIRYTAAPFIGGLVASNTTGTAPTITVNGYMEAYSQPDTTDLHGNPIAPAPDGLAVAHLVRHQIATLNNASADNLIQLQNVGNEIRGIALVLRDSTNARQNYLSDPIRWRIDQRSLHTRSPLEQADITADFYNSGSTTTVVGNGIFTGCYIYSRFRRPGDQFGEFWLPTTNATYLTVESATLGTGANLPGTVEIITDEVVPVSAVPAQYEGI